MPLRNFFAIDVASVALFFDPRVRKIKNEASSCPGINSKTLRFRRAASGGALAPKPPRATGVGPEVIVVQYVASSPGSPLPHLLDGHRKLVGSSAIPARRDTLLRFLSFYFKLLLHLLRSHYTRGQQYLNQSDRRLTGSRLLPVFNTAHR